MLTSEQSREFRLQLQHAREDALKDAEAFDGIIHVVERLGLFLSRKVQDLGKYKLKVSAVAEHSALASDIPAVRRDVHTPFSLLYDMVRNGRNDALHIGAFARHLTTHAIELALILEDALRMIDHTKYVSDYMVPEPVCAELWHPVSFVRQRMLTNSFSYLPTWNTETMEWCLVSDLAVAKYLQGYPESDPDPNDEQRSAERKNRLVTPLKEAKIERRPAKCVSRGMTIVGALEMFDGVPLLVMSDTKEADKAPKLEGMLTAFDLL